MSGLPIAASGAAPLHERFRAWRNRLVASPRFQRWAAGSPLARRVAQRRARALFDLCAGFVYSQVLSACVRLDLFARLADGPRSVAALAGPMGLSVEAARKLLLAAQSLKLVRELPGDRFALDDLGAAMIGNPSIAAFVAHHDLLYEDLADPVALLRGERRTKLSQFWPYAGDRPGETVGSGTAPADRDGRFSAYSELMSRSQALVAEDILDAYPLDAHRCLLDIGGGEGTFIAAAAARAPRLALKLFDLPAVAARARERLAASGLGSRVEVVGGSFLSDPLPQGADVVSLVRVLHDHDDESARVLLKAARKALAPGGRILIAEPFAGAPGAEPMGHAYFGFYLLAMGRGRPRDVREIAALLRDAGFAAARIVKTRRPLLTSAVTADAV